MGTQGTILAAFGGVLVVILQGCTGSPTVTEQLARKDVQAVESTYRPTTASKGLAAAPTQAGPRPALPTLSETSSLADLMLYAMLNNPGVEAAFYDWKAAVENITVARSLPDPMLTFSAELARGVESLSPALMTDPAGSWPGPGKLALRADAAYQEASKKRAVFEKELLKTAVDLKRAYFQLWVLQEQIRRLQAALAVVDEMEVLAREQLAVGNVTQQDALRAQMERDQLRVQLLNLEDSRDPALVRLRSSLGLSHEQAVPSFTVHLEPGKVDFTQRSLIEVAFERNPRLKEMHREVLQAVALYQLARKSKVPDFSFGLGADLMASPIPVMPTAGLTLPVWRDKIAAEIAAGSAAARSAEARLSAEQLDLAVYFAETAFAWREADRNAGLYSEKLIPKAESALESARAGYTGAVSGFLDLLGAERTLLQYQVEYATAAGQREIVSAEMSLLILGYWPEGVRRILPEEPAKQDRQSGGEVDTP